VLFIDHLVPVLATLFGMLIGCWTTHRAYQSKGNTSFTGWSMPGADDMPAPFNQADEGTQG